MSTLILTPVIPLAYQTGAHKLSIWRARGMEAEIYGHRITSLDDEYMTLMFRAMEATTAIGATWELRPLTVY